MKVSVSKSKVTGMVIAPASKSYTIRGLVSSALAKGESEIRYPLSSDDTEVALSVLRDIGVKITREKDSWRIIGGNFHKPQQDLGCSDSAATLRFMMAICSLVPGECRLTAGSSLARRPVKPLVQALKQLGVDVSAQGEVAPVTVRGGQLKGGTAELAGNISSQFVSALLLIAPLAEEGMKIRLTTPLESKAYVMMTLDCLKKFGIKVKATPDLREFNIAPQSYQPTRYLVEGDWSSASYFLALGALSGPITVANLNPESLQGDRILLSLLKEMGALVDIDKSIVTVRKSGLSALKADLANSIDLLPTMAVLAAVAKGVSEFTGIGRARIKESNRVLAVREALERMGVAVREERDRLTVTGTTPRGAVIDTKSDHRIAMAFGVLGTMTGKTVINNAGCVAKTYPEFWDILRSIGGEVNEDD
jgi:3-phosphoshikimate 1-carboxyvinyltransferase